MGGSGHATGCDFVVIGAPFPCSCSVASRLRVNSNRTTSALFTGRPVSFASRSAYRSSLLSNPSSSLTRSSSFASGHRRLGYASMRCTCTGANGRPFLVAEALRF